MTTWTKVTDVKLNTKYIETGYSLFDRMIQVTAGSLIVVTGSPKNGKTTFAVETLSNFASNKNNKSFMYQLEMNQQETALMLARLDKDDNILFSSESVTPEGLIQGIRETTNNPDFENKKMMFLLDSYQYIGDGRGKISRDFIRQLQRLAQDKQIVIIVINHKGKTGQQLGSSSIGQLASAIVDIERVKGSQSQVVFNITQRSCSGGSYTDYHLTEDGFEPKDM